MRKLFALVLSLMLLVTFAASAQTVECSVSPADGMSGAACTFEVPDSWQVMSRLYLEMVYQDKARMQELLNAGFPQETLDLMRETMASEGFVMVYDSDFTGNFNLSIQPNPQLTMEFLQDASIRAMLDHSNMNAMIQSIPGLTEDSFSFFDLQSFDDSGRLWYLVGVTTETLDMAILLTMDHGYMFTFTFNGIAAEDIVEMLVSFATAQ